MTDQRPKLWIIGGPGLPAAEFSTRLADHFDIRVIPPALADEIPVDSSSDLVLTRAADLAGSANPTTQGQGDSATAIVAIDAISQAVALATPAGVITWANARYRTLPDSITSQIPGAIRSAAKISSQRSDGPIRRDLVAGDTAAFELTLTATSTASIALVVRDISSDRRLRARIDAIDAAGASLVSIPAEDVRKLHAAERFKLLETKIVQACRDLLRFDHFLVRIIDDRTGKLEMIMHSGLPQEAIELDIRPGTDGNGITGYVAATGKSYICYDTEQDGRFLPGFTNARSSLTVPLKLHDRTLGVFNVESDRVGAFSEDDRQFAEIFSRYVTIALHMLKLLNVERSATSETFSGRVEGELSAPLQDILKEADWLKELGTRDPEAAKHVQRIIDDVDSIRKRVKNVATGAQTLLGVDEANAKAKLDPVLHGKIILVADDEANIRRIVHDCLQLRGAIVVTCPSGVEAIAALEAAAAGERPRFDAVLSDIRMPDRNGYEVFAAARKSFPGLPVILMTGFGYDPHHSIVRASQEGLQNVLFKPFPVDRLLEELRKAVSPK